MPVSLIDVVGQGGCYWKREQHDSLGHSIAIPNGTAFKIAIEGPQSHRFATGVCRDGYFVLDDGERADTKFSSANEAVNSVREPSTNAFLYLHFRIGDSWVRADDLRRSEQSRFDEAEEAALEDALYAIRHHPQGRMLERVEATRKAALLVAKHPTMIDDARQRLVAIAAIAARISLADFGLA